MRCTWAILLVVLTIVTGVALGHARGQVMAGGTLVLCVGERVVTIPDRDGTPGHDSICPDMALGLMAALAAPPPLAAPQPVAVTQARTMARPAPRPFTLNDAPRARGPPAVAV